MSLSTSIGQPMKQDDTSHPALRQVKAGEVINRNSPVPLHHQLETFLRQGIEEGRFPPNETLPTEQELQDFFNLSRTPIRQALSKLSADGLVVRQRSHGTVVLPRPFEENLRSLSPFTEEVQRKGHNPGARIIEFKSQPADGDDITMLNLTSTDSVYHIERVRYIDEEPVGNIVSHIPVYIVSDLKIEDFTEEGPRQSIYNVLEQVHGIRLVRATETFRAVNLRPEAARLLNMPPDSAVLMRTRVTFDPDDRAVALEYGLYRGVYRLEWEGREVSSIDTTTFSDSPTSGT